MEEAVVASQPQTTISSEADISRQQRGSQEPSSEYARNVSPLDSGGDIIAESNNNRASVTAVHVDSSGSLLTENITQSTSVPSQSQGEEEREGERGEMQESEGTVSIVVGIVEPERADQPPKSEEHPQLHPEPQQLQLQKEEEQLELVAEMAEEGEREREEEVEDREAVGDVREGVSTEEEGEEEAGVVEPIEDGAHVKDATREQADTTQKLEEGIICICIHVIY